MERFWMLTYLDMEDKLCQHKYEDEQEAMDAWHSTPFALFLDEVIRLSRNV